MMRKLILTVITLTTLALSATPAQFTPPTNLATIPTANYHDCLNRCHGIQGYEHRQLDTDTHNTMQSSGGLDATHYHLPPTTLAKPFYIFKEKNLGLR